jgi:aarF domain-containing kinase
MQRKFSRLFDDAPQISYSTIRNVFLTEFGRPPEEVFEVFEEEAVASASIAQVHRAKLWTKDAEMGAKEEERWVAVKIQKPDVGRQVEWDLGAFRIVMWMFEHWVFDLPTYFVVGSSHCHLWCAFLKPILT